MKRRSVLRMLLGLPVAGLAAVNRLPSSPTPVGVSLASASVAPTEPWRIIRFVTQEFSDGFGLAVEAVHGETPLDEAKGTARFARNAVRVKYPERQVDPLGRSQRMLTHWVEELNRGTEEPLLGWGVRGDAWLEGHEELTLLPKEVADEALTKDRQGDG